MAAATIRDVARSAGVSVASVSRALNGAASVHPDMRARVVAASDALGYVPHEGARSLSTARSHAIGVVLPDLHGEFFSEMVRGLDRAASTHGFHLLLSNMHADAVLASKALRTMRGRVDGLVVMAPQLDAAALAKALPAIPTVTIASPDSPGRHAIRIDNRGGAVAMTRHLIEGGRTAIVHVAGAAGNIDARERRDGYLAALGEFAPDQAPCVITGDFKEESGAAAIEALARTATRYDAIFAANDTMALGALKALRALGVTVPDEVAVAGFDDIPLARYLDLTTVHVDIAGIGMRAISYLVDALAGRSGGPALDLVTTAVVARATTTAREPS